MINKYYSWNSFENDIKLISEKIKYFNPELKCIVAIPRGGLVIGVKLSHLLELPLMFSLEDAILKYRPNEIIVVDDISDSGKTLIDTLECFKTIKTLTLHYKKESMFKPNYFCNTAKSNEWIVYPWEQI